MNDMTRIAAGIEAPTRFSIEEFMGMVDAGIFEGWKVELVEGEVVRMSPAMSKHMRLQRAIYRELDAIFGDDGEWIVQFEASIQLGDRTLRDIDVAVIRPFKGDREFVMPGNARLAVEVSVSTLSYDLHVKGRDYARAEIPVYWVFDSGKEVVHVLTNPIDGDYTERHLVPFGQPLAVPGTDRSITIA